MLRSVGKKSGESVESVLKKKRKAMVGRICRKEGFGPGMKEWGVRVVSRWNRWKKCLHFSMSMNLENRQPQSRRELFPLRTSTLTYDMNSALCHSLNLCSAAATRLQRRHSPLSVIRIVRLRITGVVRNVSQPHRFMTAVCVSFASRISTSTSTADATIRRASIRDIETGRNLRRIDRKRRGHLCL